MMERVALSAGRCGSECVEYSVNRKLKALDSKAYIKFDEENIKLCVNI